MTRFQALAVSASGATLAPIALGGVVRATGSGDGCPDWPRCFGNWIPPLEYHALLEYSHRVVAAVSGLVLVWLAITVTLRYRRVPAIFRPGIIALPLVIIQGWLGKEVVEGGLSPTLVTIHLANALLLAGALVILAVNSFFFDIAPDGDLAKAVSRHDDGERNTPRTEAALAIIAAGSVLLLVLTGAYMRGIGGALAFLDWPLMDSRLLPSMTSPAGVAHFLHRLLALAVGIFVGVLVARSRKWRDLCPGYYRLVCLGGFLFLIQTAIGALNVFSRLAPWARSLHVVFATLTWGSFVAAATLARLRSQGLLPLAADSQLKDCKESRPLPEMLEARGTG